jgi:hypothetical protein
VIFDDQEVELLKHTAELLVRLTDRHVSDADIADAEDTADQIGYLLHQREQRRLRGMLVPEEAQQLQEIKSP